jgi:transposase
MSVKELRRVEVLGRVKAKTLSLRSAATLLGLSYRQTKRVWRRFRRRGARGLQHQSAGRSNRQITAAIRKRALALIRQKYSGPVGTRFGPTLAAEHLASEDDVHLDHETLRRWMLAAGLWSPTRRRAPYRQRRERKAHFGELVQFDGSFHRWYEDRGPHRCLITMVDDATSTMTGRFSDQETLWAAVAVLRTWIVAYGVPLALYTDWKNVYVRAGTDAEIAAGVVPLTQFGRMCAALEMRIIPASSPQAKGRVERNHGTHQDRLVKKLRRRDVADDATANTFLTTGYWPAHNARFAQPAAAAEDFHRRAPSARALDRVFRLEETRVVGQDWVVQYHTRVLQLQPQSGHAPARSTVSVCEWEDGRLAIEYRGQAMRWTELARPRPAIVGAGTRPTPSPPPAARPQPRPGADHPWRHRVDQFVVVDGLISELVIAP